MQSSKLAYDFYEIIWFLACVDIAQFCFENHGVPMSPKFKKRVHVKKIVTCIVRPHAAHLCTTSLDACENWGLLQTTYI
jgi:hypothetical protein